MIQFSNLLLLFNKSRGKTKDKVSNNLIMLPPPLPYEVLVVSRIMKNVQKQSDIYYEHNKDYALYEFLGLAS